MAAETHSPVCESFVQVRLTRGPIHEPALFVQSARGTAAAGAVISFQGWVRGSETGTTDVRPQAIIGLEYQVYEPMTSRELGRLADQYAQRFGVLAVDVEHSFGFVGNGECSFVLQVAAAHRREAIDFVDEFIDAMKRHVPIWKVPHWNPPE